MLTLLLFVVIAAKAQKVVEFYKGSKMVSPLTKAI